MISQIVTQNDWPTISVGKEVFSLARHCFLMIQKVLKFNCAFPSSMLAIKRSTSKFGTFAFLAVFGNSMD